MAIRREFLHTTLNDLGKSRSVELRQIFSDCLKAKRVSPLPLPPRRTCKFGEASLPRPIQLHQELRRRSKHG
jgi:hypothetical protein